MSRSMKTSDAPSLPEIEFQLDELTRPPRKRPSVLSVFSDRAVDSASRLLDEVNEKRCATWSALKRSFGRDWDATSRELTLTVEHVHTDLGFSCAVDESSHRYAITNASAIDFEPEVGQRIRASVRQAFVAKASRLEATPALTHPVGVRCRTAS